MKLLKFDEAAQNVRHAINHALTDEQIGHINDKLMEALYTFNCNVGKGMGGNGYTTINQSDIPDGEDVPLKLLASLLCAAGWNATHNSDQRDGEWIHIDLPKVGK